MKTSSEPKTERNNLIKEAYLQLHSYTAVGKQFGICRQRVHQIVTGYKTGLFWNEKELGDLPDRISFCNLCKKKSNEVKIYVHHKDKNYLNNKPENLLPVCSKCHGSLHQMLGWSMNNGDKCKGCGRNSLRHQGHGLCDTCLQKSKGYQTTEQAKQRRWQRYIRLMLEDDSYWEYTKEIQKQRLVRKAIGEYIDKRKKQ